MDGYTHPAGERLAFFISCVVLGQATQPPYASFSLAVKGRMKTPPPGVTKVLRARKHSGSVSV
jgi:hypothetical protein